MPTRGPLLQPIRYPRIFSLLLKSLDLVPRLRLFACHERKTRPARAIRPDPPRTRAAIFAPGTNPIALPMALFHWSRAKLPAITPAVANMPIGPGTSDTTDNAVPNHLHRSPVASGIGRVGLVAASFIPGPIGWVASGALAVDAVRRGRYAEAALSLLGPAGRGLKYAARVTQIARSTKSWRAAKGAIKHVVKNGNNTLRIGRGRVSLGPQHKHWKKLPKWRRAVDRIHIHIERGKIGIDWNRKSKPLSKYVSWGKKRRR